MIWMCTDNQIKYVPPGRNLDVHFQPDLVHTLSKDVLSGYNLNIHRQTNVVYKSRFFYICVYCAWPHAQIWLTEKERW